MKNIVLIGGGSNVSSCIDIIEKENKYCIAGITDPFLEIGTEIMGYKVIGKQENLRELINTYKINGGLITIGDNWTRKIVYEFIINQIPDFEFVSSIHPSVILGKNVKIGKGTVIGAGCILNSNVMVGEFCLFVSGSILEHDSIMEDFSSIHVGSVTGGKVLIGKYSAITSGVILFDRIKIGDHTIIGSGSLVNKNIPDHVVAYGSPAKIIRERKAGEKYLQ
jgi:sugar O-acyltransferase (sialic acid O-acetyltransferase NeuD family)